MDEDTTYNMSPSNLKNDMNRLLFDINEMNKTPDKSSVDTSTVLPFILEDATSTLLLTSPKEPTVIYYQQNDSDSDDCHLVSTSISPPNDDMYPPPSYLSHDPPPPNSNSIPLVQTADPNFIPHIHRVETSPQMQDHNNLDILHHISNNQHYDNETNNDEYYDDEPSYYSNHDNGYNSYDMDNEYDNGHHAGYDLCSERVRNVIY